MYLGSGVARIKVGNDFADFFRGKLLHREYER